MLICMKVLMLKDVKGVAQRGTIKEVSDGYALNFLIARGLAVQATREKLAQFDAQQKVLADQHAAQEKQWDALAKTIEGTTIEVSVRANPAGHLYQQLSPALILEALCKKYGTQLPTDAVVINAPIKSTGEVSVGVKLGKRNATVTVRVIPAAK